MRVEHYPVDCDECGTVGGPTIQLVRETYYCAQCLKRAYDMAQDAARTPRPQL